MTACDDRSILENIDLGSVIVVRRCSQYHTETRRMSHTGDRSRRMRSKSTSTCSKSSERRSMLIYNLNLVSVKRYVIESFVLILEKQLLMKVIGLYYLAICCRSCIYSHKFLILYVRVTSLNCRPRKLDPTQNISRAVAGSEGRRL